MESLASILAGAGANPYQMPSQGIAPLLSQLLLAQQMGPAQLGQASQAQGMTPAQVAGLGGMGAAAQYPNGMPGTLPLMSGAGAS